MATSEDDSRRFTLSDANRNKINTLDERIDNLEEKFEGRLNELETENMQLRRELAELKDEGGDF